MTNFATDGSGGGLADCDGQIVNTVIAYNYAALSGGGVYNPTGSLINDTVYGNTADNAGGGIASATPGVLRNTILWGNSAGTVSGTDDVQGAYTPNYCDIAGWTGGGTGNLDVDPGLADPMNSDFSLLPFSECIDAGGTVSLTNDDLLYIVFGDSATALRFTTPVDPVLNSDYIKLDQSDVVSVRPDDSGTGNGGGYLRFNKSNSPDSAWIAGATGILGASSNTVEILLNRVDNQLTTDTLYAWAVVVDPASPAAIKGSVPVESNADDAIDALPEIQPLTTQTIITDWRRF